MKWVFAYAMKTTCMIFSIELKSNGLKISSNVALFIFYFNF